MLVGAVGALAEPHLPDIEGIENFRGKIFHSARWDHSADLPGKRVALIGTGASAIQIGPAIADEVARLDVYQRTAPWIMPRRDRTYSKAERFAFKRIPFAQRAVARGDLLGPRDCSSSASPSSRKILLAAQRMAAKQHRKRDHGSRDCARRSPRTGRSAASGS